VVDSSRLRGIDLRNLRDLRRQRKSVSSFWGKVKQQPQPGWCFITLLVGEGEREGGDGSVDAKVRITIQLRIEVVGDNAVCSGWMLFVDFDAASVDYKGTGQGRGTRY